MLRRNEQAAADSWQQGQLSGEKVVEEGELDGELQEWEEEEEEGPQWSCEEGHEDGSNDGEGEPDSSSQCDKLTVHFTDDEDQGHLANTNVRQAREGRDLQGIPWERLRFSRTHYRSTRLSNYRNYVNLLPEDSASYRPRILAACTPVNATSHFYGFLSNNRRVHSNIVHFQLRNLVWALSCNDIFTCNDNVVSHFSPFTGKTTEVLNLAGSSHANGSQGLGRVQISTLCVSGDLVVAGGFGGELVVQRLGETVPVYNGRLTTSENGITNGLEISESLQHGLSIIASNNDSYLRIINADTMRTTSAWFFDWAVNFASMRPEGHVIAVVGDDPATELIDIRTGSRTMSLQAHDDFSFAAAWHPHGHLLATGNQDTTTCVWDVRSTRKPLARMPGCMAAIRSLRFSSDGKILAAAEQADFVHLYDVATNFTVSQQVGLFGDIAGMSFTPMSDAFFIGVADTTYASLLHFNKHQDSAQDLALGAGGMAGAEERLRDCMHLVSGYKDRHQADRAGQAMEA